jgi:hypothetical protein
MIRVRGDGLFRFDEVDHHLHWIAEISQSELIRYLEGGYSEAIDKAPWRLNDGREFDHTYLGLDLTQPKSQVSSVGIVRAEHPVRGWISAHDFLVQTMADSEASQPKEVPTL